MKRQVRCPTKHHSLRRTVFLYLRAMNTQLTLTAATSERSLKNILDTHVGNVVEDDYFGLLAYIEMEPEN